MILYIFVPCAQGGWEAVNHGLKSQDFWCFWCQCFEGLKCPLSGVFLNCCDSEGVAGLDCRVGLYKGRIGFWRWLSIYAISRAVFGDDSGSILQIYVRRRPIKWKIGHFQKQSLIAGNSYLCGKRMKTRWLAVCRKNNKSVSPPMSW